MFYTAALFFFIIEAMLTLAGLTWCVGQNTDTLPYEE